MNLSPSLENAYTREHLSAAQAQRLAEFIAFGPAIFQASRLMVKFGLLDLLRDSDEGMTMDQLSSATGLSAYAVKVLLEASLSIGTVLVDKDTDRFTLSKTGWFLLNNPMTRVNMDFNHDVNYEGWFRLEESLLEGRPAGLEHFGNWPTIYEGLSQLPPQVQKSWFGFDHYYSDHSFDNALRTVFSHKVENLLDVGGNTGKWALRCVAYDPEVQVTVVDLPQQISMMEENKRGREGADRIRGYGMNLLDRTAPFPADRQYDVIWMSQFLDCFGEEEIVSILSRASASMGPQTRLCIMETFWDRQKFETAALCLTLTSLYFTALANGNSKMYHSDDMRALAEKAGLRVEAVHDNLGPGGHSIMVCRKD